MRSFDAFAVIALVDADAEMCSFDAFAVVGFIVSSRCRLRLGTVGKQKQVELKPRNSHIKETIMSKNPLEGRGRAEEERWAREQDARAIEALKNKDAGCNADKKGCGCGGKRKQSDGNCPCGKFGGGK